MDQEAKYWRDKWLEAVRQIEVLKQTFLKENKRGKKR